jgi:hypothetical protein
MKINQNNCASITIMTKRIYHTFLDACLMMPLLSCLGRVFTGLANLIAKDAITETDNM